VTVTHNVTIDITIVRLLNLLHHVDISTFRLKFYIKYIESKLLINFFKRIEKNNFFRVEEVIE